MTEPEFKDKFIAFIDVLGFKNLVDRAEAGTGLSLGQLLTQLQQNFDVARTLAEVRQYGPITCPGSSYLQRDLDFFATQISDCMIASTEVSPAGVINLVSYCWSTVFRFLKNGLLCRGYITRGLIYHNGAQFVGSGYQKAMEQEKMVTAFRQQSDERGTPFVEIDPAVCGYVRDDSDQCVREMFSRFVSDDGEVMAIFPFRKLSPSFTYDGGSSLEMELQEINVVRKWINDMKDKIMQFADMSNPSACRKIEHYIRVLDKQLELCDEAEETTRHMRTATFPAHMMSDLLPQKRK